MLERVNRVLLVDDNADIHADFRKVLEPSRDTADLDSLTALMTGVERTPVAPRSEPEIDSAYQGEEALELVTRAVAAGKPYCMAFVDMRMPPGWDGLETIQRLWDVDPYLQVVICSAYSDYEWDDVVARLARPDQLLLLQKPFDVHVARQLCCALIAKWNLWREARNKLRRLEEQVEGLRRELAENRPVEN